MARVRDVGIEEVPAEVRPVYQRFADEYGPFMNQVRVFAHRPPALKHIMGLLLELKDEALLPSRYLEIAIVVVSRLTECRYCVAHHAPKLIDQGVAPEAAARILEPVVPGFDAVDMLVRDYAIEVSEKWGRIPEQRFVELRQHFTEAQIVELTLRTALCGFFNRFNEALGIEMEPGVIEDMLARGAKLEHLPPAHAAPKAAAE